MRRVKMSVGAAPLREQRTWAYPNGEKLGQFLIPVYDCFVEGTDDDGTAVRERFDVLRFGVHCPDGKSAGVVGLANQQTHTIKAWLPHYRVHSARSPENGAWQVYKNFLIHDGPDDASELFATIGCVEVMGPQGFVKFNDLLISLSGCSSETRDQQLDEIGRAGSMSIMYARAPRPALKKAR
jgi:hypothetical protein